jgi:hypothetical protein
MVSRVERQNVPDVFDQPSRVGLVTALLPPQLGGTNILVWRLFQGRPDTFVVSGLERGVAPATDLYRELDAPTLHLPYPRLRGYKYGLAPVLGAAAMTWLAARLPQIVAFFREHRVDHVVSIPHGGPFALLGLMAARILGVRHTFYILDAWEEGATGPLERKVVKLGLRRAGQMPRSRVAAVSPALLRHYRTAFGFREGVWIPNPAPLPIEAPPGDVRVKPIVLFSGGIKPFNEAAIRCAARAMRRCKVAQTLLVTGPSAGFSETLRAHGEMHGRVEFKMASRLEVATAQREASVLLITTNVGSTSQTSIGYLPGRLPEYVAARRPILVVGPEESDAARAVRHWHLGRTTNTQDEGEIAELFDALAREALETPSERARPFHDRFLELFSVAEARRRLVGGAMCALSPEAAQLAADFERP